MIDDKPEKSKKKLWGEIAIVVVVLLLVAAFFRISWEDEDKRDVMYNLAGGYDSLDEFARCHGSETGFIEFPVSLFVRGEDATYVLNDSYPRMTLELSDWLVIRFFNKELDRAFIAQNRTPGENLTCGMVGHAPYTLIWDNPDGLRVVNKVVNFEEIFSCHAPNGVDYVCDFDEKKHVYDLFNVMRNESKKLILEEYP